MHLPICSFTHTFYSISIYFKLLKRAGHLGWPWGDNSEKETVPDFRALTSGGLLKHDVCSRAHRGASGPRLGGSHPGKEGKGHRQREQHVEDLAEGSSI